MTDTRTPPGPAVLPAGTRTRLAAPLAALAAVTGAFAYVAAHDPHEPGHYPACPLLQFTGVFCPGCGGLRAAHALAHGDVTAALGANALAVAGIAACAVLWLHWCVRVIRARPVDLPVRPAYLWFLAGLGLAFTVVRNLPFGGALTP
ncbi:hypothetical protein N566_18990 [Streptomycetaceae bacterium MP113-05]|nr:hypothetical protein N566_18990 [Streptomycetaceae bacterium MP113-05]